MIQKTHIFFQIILAVLFFSCNNSEEKNSILVDDTGEKVVKNISADEDLLAKNWLPGYWRNENDNPRLQTHEIWWVNDEGILEGKEFYVKLYYDTTKSTQHFIMPNDKGEYEHVILTKNDEKTVFKLTAQANDSLKFENPAHKWPQTIVYKKITADSMVITLDGFVFESQRTLDFKMSRYNPNEPSKYQRPEKN